MANFNLNDYETVEERLRRFWAENPDARIVTINHTTPEDRSVSTWVVEARIYLSAGDQSLDLPKATGWAFEIDGQGGMANRTSALENAETSCIGRALANMNYSGNRRVTREEMQKVERNVAPTPPTNWLALAKGKSVDELRILWAKAQAAKASQEILDAIREMAGGTRTPEGKLPGAEGSSDGGAPKRKPSKSPTV